MRKLFTVAAGALMLGGTMATTTAEAGPGGRHWHGGYGGHHRHFHGHGRHWGHRHHHHYGYGHRRRGNHGAAIAAGVAGALIGGAIAAQQPRYHGYGYGYGAPRAYYGY